jgi:uncharacterized protein YbaA (DUF1428 family)
MSYIDGYMVAVPTAKKDEYAKFAARVAEIVKEHGVLSVTEGWGNEVPDGKETSMPMAVKCQDDETVVFAWYIWESKASRDAGWEKIMTDERLNTPTPFDGKRMIFGGFDELINQ